MNIKYKLQSISPVDGRYFDNTQELSLFFSEEALMKYRVKIEVEYLIALGKEKKIKNFKVLSPRSQDQLRHLYERFSTEDAKAIKTIEKSTNHDVKAVEYWLKDKTEKLRLKRVGPWIHFALTSEDVNNLAYTLMWKEGMACVMLPLLKNVTNSLKRMARKYRSVAMLSLTHGQPASPTTLGKELAVFVYRLNRQILLLKNQEYEGKLNGATGVWSAHIAGYPEVNWRKFSEKFVKSLGLMPSLLTTQIASNDTLAEGYHTLSRINSIYQDFCQDVWLYISRGIFSQKRVTSEVGSSTMPHKINPIQFENAEGNLGLGNALLAHMAQKLTVSRMQRDLTGSTVIRNQGLAAAYSFLAFKNILKGLGRLDINRKKINDELEDHWEILAEPIQTILRKNGISDAYEQLKKLTRGEKMSEKSIHEFVDGLKLPADDKKRLLELSPKLYTGLANELVDLI